MRWAFKPSGFARKPDQKRKMRIPLLARRAFGLGGMPLDKGRARKTLKADAFSNGGVVE
jgi:hypothetical protein